MIGMSENFVLNTAKSNRQIRSKIEIDWNLNGFYTDESENQLILEVERKVNEPLGGISVGIADIELTNANDRFTPPVS